MGFRKAPLMVITLKLRPTIRWCGSRTVRRDTCFTRTHDHSTMAVAHTGIASTQYDVPAGMETGLSDLVVVANGIPSGPSL